MVRNIEIEKVKSDVGDIKIHNPSKGEGIGILITHGTDTMSWGLAALRYVVKNPDCNIAITGAQRPLVIEYSSTDGGENIRNSLHFLTKIKPPQIGVVFDFGRRVFSSRLEKKHKWDWNAFIGEESAKIKWDELKLLDQEMCLKSPITPLKELHLIRTGGTIESAKGETGALAPNADFVEGFLKQEEQKKYYRKLCTHSVAKKDSSNMVLDDWILVGKKIVDICKSSNEEIICDEKFEKGVKLITVNPLYTSEDYLHFSDRCKGGIVIAGYGAGNVNSIEEDEHSAIPLIKAANKKGLMVVLTSQVLEGVSDFEYDVGLTAVREGAIPSGDLTPSESQIKLSYILGHKEEIRKTAERYDVESKLLAESAFLAGISFRNRRSKENYLKIRKGQIVILDYNPFVFCEFSKAIKKVARKLKEKIKKELTVEETYEEIIESFERMDNNLSKINDFVFDAQLFINENLSHGNKTEAVNHVRLLLARAYLRLQGKWDAEIVLNNISNHSKYYSKARKILTDIQKDTDNDGWCDAIEKELGSDPYDADSTPI